MEIRWYGTYGTEVKSELHSRRVETNKTTTEQGRGVGQTWSYELSGGKEGIRFDKLASLGFFGFS